MKHRGLRKVLNITLLILCMLLVLSSFPSTENLIGGFPHSLFFGSSLGVALIIINVFLIAITSWM